MWPGAGGREGATPLKAVFVQIRQLPEGVPVIARFVRDVEGGSHLEWNQGTACERLL